LSPRRNTWGKSSARADWQIPARRDFRIYARQPIHQEVALRSFDQLIGLLSEIPDPRRAEGRLYKLPYVLLFSILAAVTGGNSYRSIETFITVHRRRLNAAFGLNWKRAPAHTAIRYILQGLDPKGVEQAFRRHAAGLLDGASDASQRTVALDGKVLRGSFDNFRDRKAAQLLHAFDTEFGLVLPHIDIDEKSNEIPAALTTPLICQTGPKTSAKSGWSCSI
jgi:hypothetical protein